MSIWKKKRENAVDFAARHLTDNEGKVHWKPGAYQGGFLSKKTTHGRVFIVIPAMETAKDKDEINGEQSCQASKVTLTQSTQ